jgi:hypothetical protein
VLERELEILIRIAPENFLPEGWSLIAQQLGLPSGRLDMLYSDQLGDKHIVELKKGRATESAVDQVLRYATDLRLQSNLSGVIPWVIANEITEKTRKFAIEKNVRTLEITREKCFEVIEKNGITASDLLGKRLQPDVLHGGSGGVRKNSIVPFSEVKSQVDLEVADVLQDIKALDGIQLVSGAMQTTVSYKGVKLGGYNRKHRGGHGYLSEGVIINIDIERSIKRLGFTRSTKPQKNKGHEHVWWELSKRKIEVFPKGIALAMKLVDEILSE